jgi:hypothetical protein
LRKEGFIKICYIEDVGRDIEKNGLIF